MEILIGLSSLLKVDSLVFFVQGNYYEFIAKILIL